MEGEGRGGWPGDGEAQEAGAGERAGQQPAAADATGDGGGGDAAVTEAGAPAEAAAGKKKSRPRLTLRADVMERLKNIAAVREMSASDLADELLGNFLSAIPDDEVAQEGTVDGAAGSEGAGSVGGGGRGL